jgi:hypothetical protein
MAFRARPLANRESGKYENQKQQIDKTTFFMGSATSSFGDITAGHCSSGSYRHAADVTLAR